jgi:hypothetical protein
MKKERKKERNVNPNWLENVMKCNIMEKKQAYKWERYKNVTLLNLFMERQHYSIC